MTSLFNYRVWWTYQGNTYGRWLIEYESQRSGVDMQYRFHWKFWLSSSGAWSYDAIKMPIYLDGVNVETIQVKTYNSNEKGWTYEGTTGWYTVKNKLSGTVPVYFQAVDTGGYYQADWNVMDTSPTYNLPVGATAVPTVNIPTISAIGNISANASFSNSSNGNLPITANYIDLSASNFGTVLQTITGTSGSFTNLTPNTTYYARARSTNAAGTGYSAVKSFTTPAVDPGTPSSITIPTSAAPDQTISVSWGAASGANTVNGYQLAYSKDGGASYSYVTTTNRSYSLNLDTLGFEHGSKLTCAVRAYSIVNNITYYGPWKYSGTITTNFVAPSAPATVTIPSSIAPDKTASISWAAASGGTNGVKGYKWEFSRDGGSTWVDGGKVTSGTSASLNLNTNGFVHGSKLAVRVRAYTQGHGVNYYSGYKTSGSITTSFVAPSAPQTAGVNTDMPEPIPTGTYKGGWSAPASTGSNGISGYRVQWLKNGANFGSEYDVNGISTTKATTEDTIQPGDTISFKVRAYTIGQNNRYYGGYTTSGIITIVSDKFIYISQNGGSFTKYKAFISVNGGSFTEIKKEKLKVI